MSQGTLYISPEYNPHSLQRDWGFVVSVDRRDVFEVIPESLATIRTALYFSIVEASPLDCSPPSSQHDRPAKVTTDESLGNGAQLYHEVGFDIMSLALLADVPAHRPLHLTQNSLIGHWRWLRDVWRVGSSRPQCTATMDTRNAVTEALRSGKNNLAIAELRNLFKKVQQEPDNAGLYISFLNSLSLFCPFIATELLWRQGQIEQDPISRSRTKDKEGIAE
ncbi:hypothetical protein [Thalassospira sp. ER-Se-21-Dark]|uniref:hypothetical protein n=1 Tax=Thalassospira sp. ER-Se-21-Dark TaxID=2585190 RepID=UPI001B30EC89|nr:hypothetical protein [Thalassospira sp. ER-Se-21-Dark]MBP3125463.1 hypothetical protein [Thalassospira sp. ER-Se-21-Dark]